MRTNLMAVLLVASVALSVSPADATTEVVVTSGSVFSHAGFAALDLHGSEFDLQASLFGPGIGDFAPDDLCSPCPLGFSIFNVVQFGSPNLAFGTLTWQGASYDIVHAADALLGGASGFFMRLPSESGPWHVDFPSAISSHMPDFDLRIVGTGVWSLNTHCDAETNSCTVVGTFIVRVKRQVLACDGFASPADDLISLPRNANRVIPLQITLQDWWSHEPATESNIPGAKPAVQISFSSGPGVPSIDVTNRFVPVGAADGNAFRYDATTNTWQLYLSTRPFKSTGTYIVRVVPGSADYAIDRNDFDPTCVVQFTRQ